jgi:hypothetical protein
MLISMLDLEKEDAPRFRAGTLRAIGRVAQVARDAMLPALPKIQAYTSLNNKPDTREMAFWCMRQLIPSNYRVLRNYLNLAIRFFSEKIDLEV